MDLVNQKGCWAKGPHIKICCALLRPPDFGGRGEQVRASGRDYGLSSPWGWPTAPREPSVLGGEHEGQGTESSLPHS